MCKLPLVSRYFAFLYFVLWSKVSLISQIMLKLILCIYRVSISACDGRTMWSLRSRLFLRYIVRLILSRCLILWCKLTESILISKWNIYKYSCLSCAARMRFVFTTTAIFICPLHPRLYFASLFSDCEFSRFGYIYIWSPQIFLNGLIFFKLSACRDMSSFFQSKCSRICIMLHVIECLNFSYEELNTHT